MAGTVESNLSTKITFNLVLRLLKNRVKGEMFLSFALQFRNAEYIKRKKMLKPDRNGSKFYISSSNSKM